MFMLKAAPCVSGMLSIGLRPCICSASLLLQVGWMYLNIKWLHALLFLLFLKAPGCVSFHNV